MMPRSNRRAGCPARAQRYPLPARVLDDPGPGNDLLSRARDFRASHARVKRGRVAVKCLIPTHLAPRNWSPEERPVAFMVEVATAK